MADDPSAKDDPKKDDKGDDTLGDAGKRALERERQARREAETRLKELEPLAAKVKELEEGKKSAEQKLVETADRLEARIAESDRRALIAEVAQEKKLTPAQARRLQGTTKSELEDDADDLVTSFAPPKPDPDSKDDPKKGDKDKDEGSGGDKNDTERTKDRGDPGRRPKEKLRSGSVSDADDADDDDFDAEKVADAVRSSF